MKSHPFAIFFTLIFNSNKKTQPLQPPFILNVWAEFKGKGLHMERNEVSGT